MQTDRPRRWPSPTGTWAWGNGHGAHPLHRRPRRRRQEGPSAGRHQLPHRSRRPARSPTTTASTRACPPSGTWPTAGPGWCSSPTRATPSTTTTSSTSAQHAAALAGRLGRPVGFVDDVAGPAARRAIKALGDGEILLLDNLRYLTEEVSTFERDVKLTPQQMTQHLPGAQPGAAVRLYVNDAFAAAHRASPSMVAFQRGAARRRPAGCSSPRSSALAAVADDPARPCVYLLGGLKISDAFEHAGQGARRRHSPTGAHHRESSARCSCWPTGVDLGEASERFIATATWALRG